MDWRGTINPRIRELRGQHSAPGGHPLKSWGRNPRAECEKFRLRKAADALASAGSPMDGGNSTNPRCRYGGPEAAPNLQHLGTPGSLPGYLSLRATPRWVPSKGPEGIERRRVGHCGWNSKPQTVRSAPPGW